jgi:hypothetical protein
MYEPIELVRLLRVLSNALLSVENRQTVVSVNWQLQLPLNQIFSYHIIIALASDFQDLIDIRHIQQI